MSPGDYRKEKNSSWGATKAKIWNDAFESKPSNPKDSAATSRLDLSLVPDTAIAYAALAFTEGDLKYGGYNWRKVGVRASVYKAALERHLGKWWNGEECDPKTKIPHLASVIGCVAILIDSVECGKLNDDRPPVVDQAAVLNRFEDIVKHLQQLWPEKAPRITNKDVY